MKSIDDLRDMLFSHANGHWVSIERGKSEIEDYLFAIEQEVEHDYVPMKDFAEMERFVDRIHDAADKREDVDLWGVEYVALPVDANGETIHVGDEVVSNECAGRRAFTVGELLMKSDREWGFTVKGLSPLICYFPKEFIHFHKPTRRELLKELIRKTTYLPIREDDINGEAFDAFLTEHPELLEGDDAE